MSDVIVVDDDLASHFFKAPVYMTIEEKFE